MQAMPTEVVRLSCQQCQQRKKQCDKGNPCGACLKAGLPCTAVHRRRLPRGRSGNNRNPLKTSVLQQRLSRLESLVKGLSDTQDPSALVALPTETNHYKDDAHKTIYDSSESWKHPLAQDFWSNLTQAVQDLRDVFKEDGDDFADNSGSAQYVQAHNTRSHTTAPVSSSSALHRDRSTGCLILQHAYAPSARDDSLLCDRRQDLLSVYQYRFDAIFKVLHWPTVQSLIQRARLDANNLAADACVLERTILFAAVCTLKPHEVADKEDFLRYTRSHAEASLSSADITTTTRFVVLQAFVIYLAALRTCQSNAAQWTLLPVAIRLASAQGIPDREVRTSISIKRELSLRLWHCIGMLDLQSAFDRGSRPLLNAESFQPPLNVDDEELTALDDLANGRDTDVRCTQMTFPLLTYHAMTCQHKLSNVQASALPQEGGNVNQISANWRSHQLHTLTEFHCYTDRLKQICADHPFQRFILAVAHESLLTMRLLLRRPLHRVPPTMRPPVDEYDVLGAATSILQSAMFKASTEFEPWAWYSWPKWYVLAIALAELCKCRTWDEVAWTAWQVAQQSFKDYAQIVADSKTGLLWRPIARLMEKTRIVHQRQHSQSRTGSAVQQHDVTPPLGCTTQSKDGVDRSSTTSNVIIEQRPASGSVLDQDPLTPHSTMLSPNDAGGQQFLDEARHDGRDDDENNAYNEEDAMTWFYWDSFIEDLTTQSHVHQPRSM